MTPPTLDLAEIPRRFRQGDTIYLQAASGEPHGLRAALSADPEPLAGATLTGCFLPGMNDFDYAALHDRARVVTFMAAPHLHATIADGRTQILPLSYSQIARYLEQLSPDLAILSVTPPVDGFVTLGSCADFGPLVARGARRLIGVINTAMPRPLRAPKLRVDAFEAFAEVHEPLCAAGVPISEELKRLAQYVADLTPDGATIETGIGGAPAAVWSALSGHRNLVLHSGMVGQGFVEALERGATARSGHTAGVAYGGKALASLLNGSDLVEFADVTVTHDLARLAATPRFMAINSALEVDLFGQANLEWMNGRAVSGVGGAPEFGRAARLSAGGRSILALSSTARGGGISRISLRLSCPTSLARTDVDTVVTEHGVADLREKSPEQRGQALIAIAAPQHRDRLANDWRSEQ